MKLLVDMNLSPKWVTELQSRGVQFSVGILAAARLLLMSGIPTPYAIACQAASGVICFRG